MRLQQTRDRRSTDASTSTEDSTGCGTWTVIGFCGDDTSAFVILALLVGLLLALALLSSPVPPSNPALDPFHVVPASFNRSFLLEDSDGSRMLPSKPQRGHIHSESNASDSDSEHTQNQNRQRGSPATPTSPYTPTSPFPYTVTPPISPPGLPPPAYAYDGAGIGVGASQGR
uniref:Transmembrane protein n=1 Tax=Mycena chlorophos TaxID=658473 RepID=A0ABQ0LM83_MYCCL|nr:predicted protein [Mycena chlorophos]